MERILKPNSQVTGLVLGLIGALLLLTVTSRPGVAEKADPDPDNCNRGYASICKLVETCSPKGFEDNGNCKWIYTATRYYWRS